MAVTPFFQASLHMAVGTAAAQTPHLLTTAITGVLAEVAALKVVL
jgi:hypothetical protein